MPTKTGRPRKAEVKYDREYYLAHKDEIQQRHKQYIKDNPDKAKEYRKTAYKKNKASLASLRRKVIELEKENEALRKELFSMIDLSTPA